MRQVAVVREDERTRRVGVETSDRNDTRLGRHEIDDGSASVRIARSRHDSSGLVQEHVRERLPRDALAVHFYDVVAADDRVQLSRRAVHTDPPRPDEVVRAATRSHARASEIGVQAHRGIVARVLRL
jgi:hypothetical protein